LHYCSHSTVLQ
jgi:hypothetical protein